MSKKKAAIILPSDCIRERSVVLILRDAAVTVDVYEKLTPTVTDRHTDFYLDFQPQKDKRHNVSTA